MRRFLPVCFMVVSLSASRLEGQQVRPAALQAGVDTTHRARPSAMATSGRAVSAVIGTTAGALAGAYLVYQATRPDCTGPRGFCGTDPVVYNVGFALGFLPGATLGAGLPRLGSTCPLAKRLEQAFVGSMAGGALGALAGLPVSTGAMLWLGYGGSAIGSTVAVHRCR